MARSEAILVTVLIAGATFVTAVAQRSARPRTEPAQQAVMTTAGADDATVRVVLPYVEQQFVDNSTPVPTVAPTPIVPDLSVVAQVGGTAWDVAVAGNIAYVAAGMVVKTFDVANPARPQALGQSAPLPGLAMGLVVADDHLYVALSPGESTVEDLGDFGGLAVMDLAEPAHPRLRRVVPMAGGAADVVVDKGHLLFVLATNPWLEYSVDAPDPSVRILDRSDPDALRDVARIPIAAVTGLWQIAVDGNRLFAGLWTYDVTDPAHPARMGDASFINKYSQAARGRLVAGAGGDWPFGAWVNEVLVAGTAPDDTVLDVRGTQCPDTTATNAVTWIRDGLLLVIGERGGCTVAVPEQGGLTATAFEFDGYGTAVTVRDDVAYAAQHGGKFDVNREHTADLTGGGGLITLDVAAPGPPRQMAVLDGPAAHASAVAARGESIYLLEGRFSDGTDDQPARLWVLDAHDAVSPVPLGSVMTVGTPSGFGVDDRNGYAATSAGLEVFDLSDSTVPRALGRTGESLRGSSYLSMRVLASGGFVHVIASFGLKRFDVRDPMRPKQDKLPEDVYPPPWAVADMALAEGGLAYVVDHDGLIPIRLTPGGYEPIAPETELFGAFAVAWRRGYVYVLRQTRIDANEVNLDILDAADPTRLHLVTTLRPLPWVTNPIGSDAPARLVVADDRLTVLGINGTISVYAIEDPTRPQALGRLVHSDYDRAMFAAANAEPETWLFDTLDVAAFGDYVLRAHQPGGLEILQVAP